MKRRGFLKSLLGVAALAAHAQFGSLVPIAEPEVEGASVLFLQTGDLVRLGDCEEVMRITAYDTQKGMLTVERGMRHMRLFGVEAK